MTAFKVDLAELDAVVGSLDSFKTTFAGQLGDLDTAITALQRDWLGDAADAQQVAHRRIVQGAQDMRTALAGLHQAARHAHTSYTAAVTANVQTWKQLRG